MAKKIGMTRIFHESGEAIAVTVLEVEPSVVTQLKNQENDGYNALQLGYGNRKSKNVRKPQRALFEKIGLDNKLVLYEVRSETPIEGVKPGDELGIDNFAAGDYVDVAGISIGKGFQGVMKRHHFSGGRGSHGDSTGRRTGSIGQCSYPSRVFKGMKGPGRMGGKRVTTQNLEVVSVDEENNLLVLAGSVPGPTNGFVEVGISLKRGVDKDIKVRSTQKEDKPTEEPTEAQEHSENAQTVDQPDNSSESGEEKQTAPATEESAKE